jgi:hypothetical protein
MSDTQRASPVIRGLIRHLRADPDALRLLALALLHLAPELAALVPPEAAPRPNPPTNPPTALRGDPGPAGMPI